MDTEHSEYNVDQSYLRIKEILDSSDADYQERSDIPPTDSLTFTNGFYVSCSAVFIDIRGSKNLTQNHTRPVLAKIYRAYISECIAIMRNNLKVRHLNIEGDCVWGVFSTPFKPNIDEAFATSYFLASLVDVLNWRLEKKGYAQISVGIGCSYGNALMIKAGYKGSGVNDTVYMGDVVNEAAKLCSIGNKKFGSKEIHVSNVFYSNLKPDNQKLLTKVYDPDCYGGDVVSLDINNWLRDRK